jgi:hypothetical protein
MYSKLHPNVKFQVLKAFNRKIRAFWDVVPSSLGEERRFRCAYCLHHQSDEIIHRPDDGGSTHL